MTIEQALKECTVFSALGPAELKRVASLVEVREYEAGATVHQKGDSATGLLVLQEGKVAVQATLPGILPGVQRRVTVDIVNPNEVVGWSAVVEPYIYALGVVCLQKTKALYINGAELRQVMRNEPRIGYEVMKELIKVVASRLEETRNVLASERMVIPERPR
ncbi:MAG: cyclic nucleotide-binding domain-containing protein [Chloroflexi bacterium]|nr:cyclic nucleotide-binding domain-containing protein [Chloroflexota bacterium]